MLAICAAFQSGFQGGLRTAHAAGFQVGPSNEFQTLNHWCQA